MFNKIKRKIREWLQVERGGGNSLKNAIDNGCRIGKNVDLVTIPNFGTEPYLIKVGDDSLFAWGVKLVTHDGGIRVLNNLDMFDGKRADKIGKITIGKNVYIGMNAIVMPNVVIGDNCIVGAGAVVTKNVPSNTVVAGVPSKRICSVEEYYEKCKNDIDYTANFNFENKKRYYENKFK